MIEGRSDVVAVHVKQLAMPVIINVQDALFVYLKSNDQSGLEGYKLNVQCWGRELAPSTFRSQFGSQKLLKDYVTSHVYLRP